MANPRQRRKGRSSSHRPVKHSQRANKLLKKHPAIKGHKVLQDAWDKHKTVRQNYAALGLALSLTPADSGGKDITQVHSTESHRNAGSSSEEDRLDIHVGRVRQKEDRMEASGRAGNKVNKDRIGGGKIPHGFGKIVRDGRGNVIEVRLGEDEENERGDEGMDVDGAGGVMEIGDDCERERDFGQPERILAGTEWLLGDEGEGEGEGEHARKTGVVRALEEQLELASKARSDRLARKASTGEIAYLTRLVAAHGEDYERMARDGKRNVQQYTAGRLRRAIEKAKAGKML